MSSKFEIIICTSLLTIFLIAATRIYAQREIHVFEPDFNKEYALHLGLYKDLPDWLYPNAYIEFYSDYVKKHNFKKTVSYYYGHSNWPYTIYYNKDGYIIRTMQIANDTVIYTYEYSNHYRTITRYLNNDHRVFNIYYFNENYVLDSISKAYWIREVLKSSKGKDSVIHFIKHDTVKFIYSDNGILATANMSSSKDKDIEFLIPGTNKIGAESAIANLPYGREGDTGHPYDSLGYFYPIDLFMQKEKGSNDPYYRKTTWSTYYYTYYNAERKKYYIEITERFGYMLIETFSPALNTFSSYFYGWNAQSDLVTYSKCMTSYLGGIEIIKRGKYYTRIKGGWEIKAFSKGSVELTNNYKMQVEKKGIFSKEWTIKYFK